MPELAEARGIFPAPPRRRMNWQISSQPLAEIVRGAWRAAS